jgi:hypothetical protein
LIGDERYKPRSPVEPQEHGHRLLENNAKLEEVIAQNKIAPPIAVASGTVEL